MSDLPDSHHDASTDSNPEPDSFQAAPASESETHPQLSDSFNGRFSLKTNGQLYETLLTRLTNYGNDVPLIISALSASRAYNVIILTFLKTVRRRFDSSKRQTLLANFLQLVNQGHQNLDEQTPDKIIAFLLTYKMTLTSWPLINLAVNTLQLLFRKVPQRFPPSLQSGHHAVFGWLALNNLRTFGHLLQSAARNHFPGVQALVLFFESHPYNFLSEADRNALTEFNIEALTAGLLKGERNMQILATKVWKSLVGFLPRDCEPENKIPTEILSRLLNARYGIRLAVLELLESIPDDSRLLGVEMQIRVFLPDIAAHLNSLDKNHDIAALAVVKRMRELPDFVECVASLCESDHTAVGAVIIAAEFDLFRTVPGLGMVAFPPSAEPTRAAKTADQISYVLSKGFWSEQFVRGILSQIIVIVTHPKIATGFDLTLISLCVRASVEWATALSDVLIHQIPDISDPTILVAFSNALSEFPVWQPPLPPEDLFCRCFCHLYIFLDSVGDIFHILRLFLPVVDGELPITIVELIDRTVPQSFLARLQIEAESWMALWPRLFVLVAALPSLPDTKLSEYFEAVFAGEDFSSELISCFLTVLSIRYLPATLISIESVHLSDALPTGMLASRRKKNQIRELMRGVFLFIRNIAQVLPPEFHSQIWRIVMATSPSSGLDQVIDSALCLDKGFPVFIQHHSVTCGICAFPTPGICLFILNISCHCPSI
jgi:hypothetical protein